MSRGYGCVQRAILEELDARATSGDPWIDVRAIAARIDGPAPGEHVRRSVRRALRLLAAEGLVELVSRAAAEEGGRRRVRARIAVARLDDVAIRRARRARARALRDELGVGLLRHRRGAPRPSGPL